MATQVSTRIQRQISRFEKLLADPDIPEETKSHIRESLPRLQASLTDVGLAAFEATTASQEDVPSDITAALQKFDEQGSVEDALARFDEQETAVAPETPSTISSRISDVFTGPAVQQGLLPAAVTEPIIQAASGLLGGRTFGLSERLGIKAPEPTAVPEVSAIAGGLGEVVGGIKAIGSIYNKIQGALGLGQKIAGTGAVARHLQLLETGITTGRVAPKFAHAVKLGLAAGVADLTTAAVDPEREATLFGLGLSTGVGAALGAVSVPGAAALRRGKFRIGPLSQGIRGAAVGFPVVALTGGTSSPFRIFGDPYADQLLFDFGVNFLLAPGLPKVGSRIPVIAYKGAKETFTTGEILSTSKDPKGRNTYMLRLENGMVRDYTPGVGPVVTEIPPDRPITRAPDGVLIKKGDVVVQRIGKENFRLVRFDGESPDGKSYRLGIITAAGREPQAHLVVAKSKAKLLKLEGDKLEALFPKGAEPSPPEEPVPFDPPLEDLDPDQISFITQNYREELFGGGTPHPQLAEKDLGKTFRFSNREELSLVKETWKRLSSILPPDWKPFVTEVWAVSGAPFTSYGAYLSRSGVLMINTNRGGMIDKTRGGFRFTGLDSLVSTLAHELVHASRKTSPKYQEAIRRLGWRPLETLQGGKYSPLQTQDRRYGAFEYTVPGGASFRALQGKDIFNRDWYRLLEASELTSRKVSRVTPRRGGILADVVEVDEHTIRHDRRSPEEDLAHALDMFITVPDALFAKDPARWQVIHDGLLGTPYQIPGYTREATGQTILPGFLPQRPPVQGIPLEQAAASATEALGAQRAAQIAAASGVPATTTVEPVGPEVAAAAARRRAPVGQRELPLQDVPEKRFVRFRQEFDAAETEIQGHAVTKPELVDQLYKVVPKIIRHTAINLGISETDLSTPIPGSDISVEDFVANLSIADGLARSKASGMGKIIHDALIDLRRTGIMGVEIGAVTGGEEPTPVVEAAPAGAAATAQAGLPEAPKAPKARRVRNQLDRLFGTLVGVEGKKEQLAAELSNLPDLHRNAAMMYLNIDLNGNTRGERAKFEDVARGLNMSVPELGVLFRFYRRHPNGDLLVPLQPNLPRPRPLIDRFGQGILKNVLGSPTEIGKPAVAIPEGQNLTSVINRLINPPDTERVLAGDLESVTNRLARDPNNKLLQDEAARLTHRIASLQRPTPIPMGDPSEPKLPFVQAPPPKKLAPWLKQIKDDSLLKKWQITRNLLLKEPGNENFVELDRQLTAEINARGLDLSSHPFPGGKPPKQGASTRGQPPPDSASAEGIEIIAYPEHRAWQLKSAARRGDLAPLRFELRNRGTGELLGTFASSQQRPDITPNPRFQVDPVGRVDEAGNEDATAPLRFRVRDLMTGEDYGVYTKSGVQQLLTGDYRPFVNYNPQTGEAVPHVEDVMDETRRTNPPESHIGDPRVTPAEFANMTGEVQMAHVFRLSQLTTTKEGAYRIYNDWMSRVKDYAGRVQDQEALGARIFNEWGPPGPESNPRSELFEIIGKERRFKETFIGKQMSDFLDFMPSSVGGTGRAFRSPPADAEAFRDLLEEVYNPKDPPPDPQFQEGQISTFDKITSVVRQMTLMGHPLLNDAYWKTRGADMYHTALLKDWGLKLNAILGDLTIQERIAVGMIVEGRPPQIDSNVRITKEALQRSSDARFAGIRAGLHAAAGAVTGRPATTDILIPAANAQLQSKAYRLANLYNEMADAAGFPQGKRFEWYLPHIFRRNQLGYFELPPDMNVGRDVWFRFFEPRRTIATDYELDPLQTTDVYMRGISRKIAYEPLLKEFVRNKAVRGALGPDQWEYLNRYLRFVVGEPDPSDSRMAHALQKLGIETAPVGWRRTLRRLAVSSDRPFFNLAHAVRAWQFAAKIDYNLLTSGLNASQSFITETMRHGLTGYIRSVRDRSNAEMRELFEATGLGEDIFRADIGIEAQRFRGWLGKYRAVGRAAFTNVERMNKGIAFRAGYRLFKEAGFDTGEATMAGILESDLTQFNMTRSGRLPLVRGTWGSVLFQFSPYRFEMLSLLGKEMKSAFIDAPLKKDKALALRSYKRVARMMLALNILGGVDAHFGPFVRLLSNEDDAEWGNGIVGLLDKASLDWIAGTYLQGRPFELGHRINPFWLLNQRLVGPGLGALTDILNKLSGTAPGPTTAQIIQRNLPISGAVQMERTLGKELERNVYKPLLGRKAGQLKAGETVPERLFGERPKKGSKLRG